VKEKKDILTIFAILAFGGLGLKGWPQMQEYTALFTLVSAIGWAGLLFVLVGPLIAKKAEEGTDQQPAQAPLFSQEGMVAQENVPTPMVHHPMADKINAFCRQYITKGEAFCYSYTEDENKIEFIISIPNTVSLEDVVAQKNRLERYLGKTVERMEYHPDSMDWVCGFINKGEIPDMVKFTLDHVKSNDALVWVGNGLHGPVYVDFSKFPHSLAGGTTGSGKSVLMNAIAIQIIRRSYAYFVDLKGGVEFAPYRAKGHQVVTNLKDVYKLLRKLERLNDHRMNLFLKYGEEKETTIRNIDTYRKKVGPMERVYVLFDEFSQVVNVMKGEEKDLSEGILTLVKKLGETSRSQGIHLIVSTQKPQKENIPTYIKDNLPVRLAGYCASGGASRTLLDNVMASTELNPKMKGRFILQGTGPEEIFIQTPFIEEDEDKPGPYLHDFLVPPKIQEAALFGGMGAAVPKREEMEEAEEIEEAFEETDVMRQELDLLTQAKLRIADVGIARIDDVQQHLKISRQRCCDLFAQLEEEGWVEAPPTDNKRRGYALLLSDSEREDFIKEYAMYY
jgi:hypothetical protein